MEKEEKPGFFKRFRKRREKLKKFSHVAAGLIILIHAWEKHESGHGSYTFFLAAGLVFLCIALFHHTIEKKAPWIDGVFFVIEAALSFVVSYEFFHMGKKALPYCYLLVGAGQLIGAYFLSRKGVRKHRQLHNSPS